MNNKFNWHALTAMEVLVQLNVIENVGLSTAEATARLAACGRNILPADGATRWWRQLWRQFRSPLIAILVAAGVVTAWLDDEVALTIISLSVSVNVIIGFFQERRSTQYLAQLRQLAATEAWAIRNGESVFIDPSELVPGDIVRLKSGDRVPADARLLSCRRLTANESMLSGESEAIHKQIEPVVAAAVVADRTNMLWLGTTIEQGEATAVVVATGIATELGAIARMTRDVEEPFTPLMQRLQILTKWITGVVIMAAISVFVIGLWKGESAQVMFTTAVAVAVSAVPEGLAAALSVVLAVATARILRRQGLVRRPLAAETLGSVTVLCVDKTGTLTEGNMKVTNIVTEDSVDNVILAMALANEATIDVTNGKLVIHGESTDQAKMSYALSHGLDFAATKERYSRYALLPFNSGSNLIASFHHYQKDGGRCFVSGAPEAVAALSVRHHDGRIFDSAAMAQMMNEYESLAAKGYRVIALADRTLSSLPIDTDDALGAAVKELTWRGLVVLQDPVRENVLAVMNETRQAGVRIVMITGDHRLTAMTIGRALGFRVDGPHLMDGAALAALSDAELCKKLPDVDCFVRVSPSQKLRIVQAWQTLGASVAMTGDGINDAPALATADIGVATGSATDVTREAADLVLLDDSFVTISGTIKEGRITFENMQKVSIHLLSSSFTVLALVVTSLFLGIPLPLTAAQILWANLIENGLPSFALAFEPGEDDVMKRPPIPRQAPLLDRLGRKIVLVVSPLRDLVLAALFVGLLYVAGYDLSHARSIMMAIIATDSLLYVFALKSLRRPIYRMSLFNNPFLIFSALSGVALTLFALYTPLMNTFLQTVPLDGVDWGIVIFVALVDIVLIEAAKWKWRPETFANSSITPLV